MDERMRKKKQENLEPASGSKETGIKERKLLERVASYYQAQLLKDSRGLKYLEQAWGILEKSLLEEFTVGYATGTLLEVLPPEGDVIEALTRMGVLTSRGRETLSHCVTIPLKDLSNAIVGLYGRRIEVKEGTPEDLIFPSPPRGLLNWQAAKRSQSLLLTPTILEGLRLYQEGFKNTVPCVSAGSLSPDQLDLFTRFSVKEVYCVHAPDNPGGT